MGNELTYHANIDHDDLYWCAVWAASAVEWAQRSRLFGWAVAIDVGRCLARMEISAEHLPDEQRERARELGRAIERAVEQALKLSTGIVGHAD
jgi:hypothetical protein